MIAHFSAVQIDPLKLILYGELAQWVARNVTHHMFIQSSAQISKPALRIVLRTSNIFGSAAARAYATGEIYADRYAPSSLTFCWCLIKRESMQILTSKATISVPFLLLDIRKEDWLS